MNRILQIYFIPGAVILSVIIGGGYGTGREIVQFFTRFGPVGGVLGIAVATAVFALVLACSFEFARIFRVYDYRSFFKQLIGRFWVVFEALYILLFLLVLGVVSAAAGEILEDQFAIPTTVGVVLMPALVAVLVLFGRMFVEKALAIWSLLMYAVFLAYFATMVANFEPGLLARAQAAEIKTGWLLSGALFAMYNVAVIPGLLFACRAIETRRQAISSACIAAVAITTPALLFHISFMLGYPEVLDQSLPNYWMIATYGPGWLLLLFIAAILGTLIETGVGLVQSVIERLPVEFESGRENALRQQAIRAVVAVTTVSIAALLGTLGVVNLIASGYTLISFGFALVYVVPICTLGVWQIRKRGRATTTSTG